MYNGVSVLVIYISLSVTILGNTVYISISVSIFRPAWNVSSCQELYTYTYTPIISRIIIIITTTIIACFYFA